MSQVDQASIDDQDGTRATNQPPPQRDLTRLNTRRTIIDSVGREILLEIGGELCDLAGASVAVYEANGDYVLRLFASGWCQILDQASRDLCQTDDDSAALASGRWLYHELCWACARKSMERRQPTDLNQDGIHAFAMPIFADDEVVGALNFSFADPPEDEESLLRLARRYRVDKAMTKELGQSYRTSWSEMARRVKRKLRIAANLIGQIVARRQMERSLQEKAQTLARERQVATELAAKAVQAKQRAAAVLRQRESLLHQLEEKNAELERFTYTVSHDLKSPLITIKGFLAQLEKHAAEGDRQKLAADADRIRRAAQRMEQLLDELLELSRIGRTSNPPQDVSLGDLVNEVLDMCRLPLGNRKIQLGISPDMPTVRGDRTRLRELVQNLLENAVKFTSAQAQPRISIGARVEKGEAICYIRDNGIGISPKYHEKIFDVFEKLDRGTEGSGVGLAIVRRIVETHGGRIWVQSQGENQGATFLFTLPLADGKQENSM